INTFTVTVAGLPPPPMTTLPVDLRQLLEHPALPAPSTYVPFGKFGGIVTVVVTVDKAPGAKLGMLREASVIPKPPPAGTSEIVCVPPPPALVPLFHTVSVTANDAPGPAFVGGCEIVTVT